MSDEGAMTTSEAPIEPEFFSHQITRAHRFCLDLRPDPKERLVVVCGGREQCLHDYEVHRTDFPLFCIEFVAHGGGTVKLRRKSYPLTTGTLFTYGPGVPHDILPDPAETTTKYFVDFTGWEASRLLKRHGLAPGRAVQTRAPNEVRALFDDLIHNGIRKTPYTAQITALIIRHLLLKIAETAGPVGDCSSEAFETYMRCKQYIDEHWRELRTIQEAARRCGVDVAYLCRLFRRFDHQGPYGYLSSLRMQEAADRMSEPGATVKAVAESLGFADQFHFSRVFVRCYGVSPRRFAQTVRRT
jgi:AraC-like DNA-binding protein